jgi:hypothetical protein
MKKDIKYELNIDIILKCLWAIRNEDQFYFDTYGKDMIMNYVKQELAKAKGVR